MTEAPFYDYERTLILRGAGGKLKAGANRSEHSMEVRAGFPGR